ENNLLILKRVPTISEYIKLCCAVGWEDYMNFEVAEESLNQSLFGVIVQYQGEVVGMGRVIGDGRIYFYIQALKMNTYHTLKN
ncbi:GNAT family N-acetyltransferase, partial [Paenibacillus sp. 2RAB27]